MAMTVQIKSSCGMLFPPPGRSMTLAGRRVHAEELRVRDVGRIEASALRAWPHPLMHMAKESALVEDAKARLGSKWMRDEPAADAMHDMFRAVARWPPAYGTIEFNDYLATNDGFHELLRLVLRDTPDLGRDACARIAVDMTAAEWREVARIGWGHHDFPTAAAAEDEDDGDPSRRECNEGPDWSALFARLERERGWTRDYCGDMPISQFFGVFSDGAKRTVTLPDWEHPKDEVPADAEGEPATEGEGERDDKTQV